MRQALSSMLSHMRILSLIPRTRTLSFFLSLLSSLFSSPSSMSPSSSSHHLHSHSHYHSSPCLCVFICRNLLPDSRLGTWPVTQLRQAQLHSTIKSCAPCYVRVAITEKSKRHRGRGAMDGLVVGKVVSKESAPSSAMK